MRVQKTFSLLAVLMALPGLGAPTAASEEPASAVVESAAPGPTAKADSNDKLEKAAYLGVTAITLPPALSSQLNLPSGVGLRVNHVVPESPAAAAGLRRHDVLFKLNDQSLINPRQLAVLVRTFKPGAVVRLTVIRRGETQTLTATLGAPEPSVLSDRRRRRPRTQPRRRPRQQFGDRAIEIPAIEVPTVEPEDWYESLWDQSQTERLEAFLRRLEVELERRQDSAEERLERVKHLMKESQQRFGRTMDTARRRLARILAPDDDETSEKLPLPATAVALTWRDDEELINLRAGEDGAWHVTVSDPKGQEKLSIILKDVDELPKRIRPKVRAMLRLLNEG